MSMMRCGVMLSLMLSGAAVQAETWSYQGLPVSYSLQGAGRPVVQLHGIGAGASSKQTQYQVDDLVAAGYRVYSIDWPGFGNSIGPDQVFTGPLYRDVLEAFLTDVVGEPAALVGHSLGATYAVAAAVDKPNYVAALVLDAPVGVVSFTSPSTANTQQAWSWLVNGSIGQDFYKALGSWPELKSFCKRQLYVDASFCTRQTVNDYYQYTQTANSIYGAGSFLTKNLGLDITSAYASVKQPAVLIWGTENTLSPVSDAAAFTALNASIPLVEIAAAGAMVNDEQKAQFDQAMLAVIKAGLPISSPAVKSAAAR